MTHFTRRRALRLVGAMPLLAADCRAEKDPVSRPKSTGTSAFLVSITTAYGTATVDAEPTRVVSVGHEADLRDNAIFRDLEVTRGGRVAYLGELTTAVSHNDVLSIPYAAERAARLIAPTLR